MTASVERQIAAERLRRMAYDSMQGMSFQKAVGKCVGVDGSWRDVMKRMADLIDPTCTISESYDRNANEARYTCSECGTSWSNYDTVDDGSRYTSGWAVWHNAVPVYVCHCPYCGARIVLGDENDEHR